MTFNKMVGVGLVCLAQSNLSLAETTTTFPTYSYNSTEISIFPGVEASGSDGNVASIESLIAMNDNVHLILGADYGDFDDDITKARASLGAGYNFLLEGGEASLSLSAKALYQEEEFGSAEDDDTGYALSVEVRHFYQGDIATVEVDGLFEGYWNLTRQSIMDDSEFTSLIGARYHYHEGFAVQLEAQVLEDSIRSSSSFPSVSVGVYFNY
jgi:hypothetical protein